LSFLSGHAGEQHVPRHCGKCLLPGEKYGLECFSDCVRLKETAPNEKAA